MFLSRVFVFTKLLFDRAQSKYWKVDRHWKDKQISEEFSSTINWIWVSFCNASMAVGSDEIIGNE